MQPGDHFLEFGESEIGDAGIAPHRREEADGVVAPVVQQFLVEQIAVVEKRVHREQLDCGDAKMAQVVDQARLDETTERSPDILGHIPAQHAETAHVHLINDGALPGRSGPPIVAPGKGRINNTALEHRRRAVTVVEGQVVAALHFVPEQGRPPLQLPDNRFGIGVEQQLVRVETMPCIRLVRAMNPIAVDRARARIGQKSVPHLIGVFGQRNPLEFLLAAIVEDTQFDLRGVRGKQRKVDAEASPGRSEGMWGTLLQACRKE